MPRVSWRGASLNRCRSLYTLQWPSDIAAHDVAAAVLPVLEQLGVKGDASSQIEYHLWTSLGDENIVSLLSLVDTFPHLRRIRKQSIEYAFRHRRRLRLDQHPAWAVIQRLFVEAECVDHAEDSEKPVNEAVVEN